jgi:archaellum component FlaC
MATRMQQRRGTEEQWTTANPVLGAGEIGFETDTGKFKLGDGINTWETLAYFVNADDLSGELDDYATQTYVNDAISDVVGLAPEALDTLNELASAIGDDPDFVNTIGNALTQKADISYVDDEIINSDTVAQGYADTAEANSTAYTDLLIGDATVDGTGGNTVTDRIASAVAGLVDSSPEALDTLNELAAALGDDPNFATTVATDIGTKVSKSGDTMTGDLSLAQDPTSALHAATKQYVDDSVSQAVADLETADGEILDDINTINSSINIIESDIDTLETTSATTVTDLDTLESTVSTLSSNVDTISGEVNTNSGNITTLQSDLGTLTTDTTTLQSNLENLTTEVSGIASNVENIETDLGTLTSEVALKSSIDGPAFTGTVVLPATTSIGDVSSSEIGHLNGVTSSIQNQIDEKLDSAIASSTYAPLNDPTFGGTVSLPGTTSVGDVSATEIGYLDGVTSSIQTQLTDLDTTKADLESPTFTGTVSGVTKAHVGLTNVDDTSDADKPVSTATQTALDAKASLAGATFTGDVTVETNMLIEGNLTITGTSTTINATDLSISDPLNYLAAEQYTEDVLDVGFLAATGELGGTEEDHLHSGLFRDVSDSKKWKLISNVPHPVSNVVDVTNAVKDTLVVGNIEADGVVFPDGTQTKMGVASLTEFVEKTASYTLDDLDLRDGVVEMNSASATTFTIPTNATLAWPVGASMDILGTGAGLVTIAGDAGVTVNSTPGLKLRTQWSSATILKRAENSWIVYGDLKS